MTPGRPPDDAWRPHAASEAAARSGGPMPLAVLLGGLLTWMEDRLTAEMVAAGFDDVRPAHNAVFARVPAEGIRLTDLAAAADVSKQAMAELVDDLVAKRYFRRVPDPTDGRAKLIVWDERGMQAHPVALQAFGRIDGELAAVVGPERLREAQQVLTELLMTVKAQE